MSAKSTVETTGQYIHGSRPEEQERLSILNEILNEGYLRQMGLKPGQRVLDVGSGLGQFAQIMARTVAPDGMVLGIERDPQQMATARRLLNSGEAAQDPVPLKFRRGDALKLPLLPDEVESFDVVHARFLLEHVPNPGDVIRQMLRAVRPGGRIILSDDDHSTFNPTPEPAGFPALWQAYLRSYDRLGNDPFIGRRLVALLHEAGLKRIRNSIVFFGGCAHQSVFALVAENLIGVLRGAQDTILEESLLDPSVFQAAIEGLHTWKQRPDAALWYGICWAEGVKAS
ncbi:MAG TPA: methyltransferase domain-containing protein [Acidobacteriota bacterium]|nr:methyltransferase domain-containing protein [Acidobacteriota bacterium]